MKNKHIHLPGRKDVNDLFELSGLRNYDRLFHTPFLVFLPDEPERGHVTVEIVDSVRKLLDYDDAIRVMVQWRGQGSSDYFRFTVGRLRRHIDRHPPADFEVI